jgi:hypothetical protein
MASQTESSPVANAVAAIKGIPTRDELVKMLQESTVSVTFNKLSGDQRVMTCTLDSEFLPEAKRDEPLSQAKIRNLENKNIVVWDVNAEDWRSFRYDRVTKVELVMNLNDLNDIV